MVCLDLLTTLFPTLLLTLVYTFLHLLAIPGYFHVSGSLFLLVLSYFIRVQVFNTSWLPFYCPLANLKDSQVASLSSQPPQQGLCICSSPPQLTCHTPLSPLLCSCCLCSMKERKGKRKRGRERGREGGKEGGREGQEGKEGEKQHLTAN